jgi:signal transduction histidine kinase
MVMRPIHDGQGRLFFGTRHGMVRVDPGQIRPASHELRVSIEALRVDGKSRSVPFGGVRPGSVDLGAGVAQVEIGFTAPEITAPEHMGFRWRLAGLDDKWRETDGQRSVSLNQLPPGHYRFEVMASRADGSWTQPAAMALVLRPQYWETWWFRLLCAAGGALIVGAIVREVVKRRNERAQARIEQHRAVEAERARIARDLHDEIGSNLAALAVLSDDAAEEAQSLGQSQEKWNLANRIAVETTDSMHEVLWLMGVRGESKLDLATQLGLVANRMLQGIAVRWREQIQLYPAGISAAIRQDIVLFFKEALTNVIRHSGARSVELSTAIRDGQFHLLIADNGCGFSPGAVNSGLGLKNLEKRADAAGGSVSIQSVPGAGTTVTLVIPVGQV